MKQHLAVVSLFASLTFFGCAEQKPAAEPAPTLGAEIGSAAAITTARQDAANRFRMVDVTGVSVIRAGRYWVVDLRGRDGGGVHYAIGTDGSIRERRMLQ